MTNLETNGAQWINVYADSGEFRQDCRYNFTRPQNTVVRNLYLCFDVCIVDSDIYMQMRYGARWLLKCLVSGFVISQVDSRINGEYLRQKDAQVIAKYVKIFDALQRSHGEYEAEIALTESIIKNCDIDTQQMLRHCPEMPLYYKAFLAPEPYLIIPVVLDYTSPIDHMFGYANIISVQVISGFDAVIDGRFSLKMLNEGIRSLDNFRHDYNCFASLRAPAVLPAGEHFFVDNCVYLFDNDEQQSHDNDVIQYVLKSQIVKTKTERYTNVIHTCSGALLESRAKLVRPGVYRFDFIDKKCIIERDFYLQKVSSVARETSVMWRTICTLIFKNGALSIDNCYL